MPPATDASNSRSTPGGGRDLEQLLADVGEQLLVRGHDRLARLQRGEDQRTRGLDATDHLDDHVDVGIGDHTLGVVGEHARRERDLALLREVLHRDAHDLDPHARSARDQVGVGVEQADERGADVAAPEDADPHQSIVVAHHVLHCRGYGRYARRGRFPSSGRSYAHRGVRGRRDSLGAPRAGRSRCARTPRPGAGPCCSSTPSSARRRR